MPDDLCSSILHEDEENNPNVIDRAIVCRDFDRSA